MDAHIAEASRDPGRVPEQNEILPEHAHRHWLIGDIPAFFGHVPEIDKHPFSPLPDQTACYQGIGSPVC
jgi:hypothetical protein